MQPFKLKNFLVVIVVLSIITAVTWIGNFVKLTNCDFQSPYRCEVIHGVGLFPPLNIVTVWFNSDKDAQQK